VWSVEQWWWQSVLLYSLDRLICLHSFQRNHIPEQVIKWSYLILELFFQKPTVFFFAYRWILIAENEALHSNDEILPINPTDSKTIRSEVADKTLLSSQFLESHEPHKGPSIKEMNDFICSSFGNTFDQPVHSFYTYSCEGSWWTSVTQTEINHVCDDSKRFCAALLHFCLISI